MAELVKKQFDYECLTKVKKNCIIFSPQVLRKLKFKLIYLWKRPDSNQSVEYFKVFCCGGKTFDSCGIRGKKDSFVMILSAPKCP